MLIRGFQRTYLANQVHQLWADVQVALLLGRHAVCWVSQQKEGKLEAGRCRHCMAGYLRMWLR